MANELVYIIDDDKEVIRAMEWLLKSVDLRSQSFENPKDFLEIAHKAEKNSCALLDVRMPSMSGMEVLKILQERHIVLPTIVLTGYGDIPMAVLAIKYGAVDYISKPFNEQALLELIQKVLLNHAATPTIHLEETAKQYMALTERERQVLNLVVDGALTKQIAKALGIAISTVEMHRSRIMQKMQASNMAQLIKKAVLLKI